ncbi:hypothetical protein GPECTOR_2g1088 [Gonium pectorale]|uniref:Uncharacterized protein n=1 Tax=Gonium pectorale TaxID=33097 RepID=A0A150H093_GONPE|nr:hypothetical protein GPECTOR_2g1088 [Gonium pectorale]|eukprot:KXZ55539.1 hypothetical protein GPECTOR_2g1088 [Gonium pectorale]
MVMGGTEQQVTQAGPAQSMQEAAGGRVLKPRAVRRAEEAERRARETEKRLTLEAAREAAEAAAERQSKLRRANEEFADFVEGMAASMASGKDRQSEQQQEREQRRREAAAAAQAAAERQKQEQEQADLLKSLAGMFRSFAQQTQPAAAAAAVVAAFSPAAAAFRRGGAEQPQPLPLTFLGGRRANDVQLILKPVRALRRRAYFYRVLSPRMVAADAAEAVEADDGAPSASPPKLERQQQQGQVREGTAEAEGPEQQPEGVEAAAAAPRLRPRYDLAGRAFKPRQRFQYSDNVKRVVRKSKLAAGGGAAIAANAVTAAAAAAGPAVGARAGREAREDSEVEAEEDPRGEYNSAAEVVNDMYEQIMGVRLPERAMYGRRAEVLAAMTPKDVQTNVRAWIDACGRDYALAFHAKEPLLLAQSPQALLLSLEAISTVFELTPEAAVEAALRSPQLIGLPQEQLRGTVEAVSEALEIGLQEAGKIVMRHPVLALREAASPVAQRVALLGALLPVSRDKLRQVLRQRPLLLSKSLQSLAGFMINASTALSLPLFDVSLMIAGAPGVTGVSSARLASRWESLQRATSLHPAWREQLASISPPSLGRCLVANDAAFERLQAVAELGLAGDEDFAKFKRVLTMAGGRFDGLLARKRRDLALLGAAASVAKPKLVKAAANPAEATV